MKTLLTVLILIVGTITATAQDAGVPPDLTGTWSGVARAVIFGQNSHHPGSQTIAEPPRIQEVEFTYEFAKQDGRLVWGAVWSDPTNKEPIALAISRDNRTVFGADTDGHHDLTIISENQIEVCFTMNGLSPTGAIVVTCFMIERSAK